MRVAELRGQLEETRGAGKRDLAHEGSLSDSEVIPPVLSETLPTHMAGADRHQPHPGPDQ